MQTKWRRRQRVQSGCGRTQHPSGQSVSLALRPSGLTPTCTCRWLNYNEDCTKKGNWIPWEEVRAALRTTVRVLCSRTQSRARCPTLSHWPRDTLRSAVHCHGAPLRAGLAMVPHHPSPHRSDPKCLQEPLERNLAQQDAEQGTLPRGALACRTGRMCPWHIPSEVI